MRRVLPLVLALALWPPSAAAAADELDDFESMLEAVEYASVEMKTSLLAAGFHFIATEHGWDAGSCPDAWRALSHAPLGSRAGMVATAYPRCAAMCPGTKIADVVIDMALSPPMNRTLLLVAACDVEGPDPVFTGDLADLRGQMAYEHYWAYRSMIDLGLQRLDTIGGTRAADLRQRITDDLVPWLAHELARDLPPPLQGFQAPSTTAERSPSGAHVPAALLARGAISVDGEEVCALDGWSLPSPHVRGELIAPLYDHLQELADEAKAAHEASPETTLSFRGRLLVQADQRVPYSLLRAVLHTAGQAQYHDYEFAGLNVERNRQAVSRTCLPALPPPGGAVEIDDVPPLNLTVVVEPDRYQVLGASLADPFDLPLADGDQDTTGLHELALQIHDEYPDEHTVALVPGDDVSYGALIAALDALRDRPGDDGRPDELFPYAIIAPDLDTALNRPGPARAGLIPAGVLAGLLGGNPADQPQLSVPGTYGTQHGSGGLGSAGSSGYGSGGGHFGASSDAGASGIGDLIVLGAMDKELIEAVVKRRMAQLRYCYEKELPDQPDLAGTVVIKIVIAADGSVSSAKVNSATLDNEVVQMCLAGRFMRFQFPEVPAGGIVIASVPLTFTP